MYCTALIRVWKVFPQGEETRYLYQDDHIIVMVTNDDDDFELQPCQA